MNTLKYVQLAQTLLKPSRGPWTSWPALKFVAGQASRVPIRTRRAGSRIHEGGLYASGVLVPDVCTPTYWR